MLYNAGELVNNLLISRKIDFHNFQKSEVSTCKTRILAGGQQIVRFDEEKQSLPISESELEFMESQIKSEDQSL